MAIPFIIGGVIAAATAVAGKKAYDGYQDNSLAEDISSEAKRDYEKAKAKVERAQKSLNNKTEELGKFQLSLGAKFKTFEQMAQDLLKRLEQVDTAHRKIEVNVPSSKLEQVSAFSMSAAEFATGVASGAITGGAAAFAVYGGVMTFATASTGAAISGLSGVAATNAALAAIGGGALSAGGLGVAGGTALLGGVVAAPVAAVMAWSYASSAERNLEKARQMRDEVEEIERKCGKIVDKLEDVRTYVSDVHNVISDMNGHFNVYYNYIKDVHDLVFVKRISDAEIQRLSADITLRVNNGLGIAACITDIVVTPLFKLNQKKEILTDSDNIPLENKEQMRTQIVQQGALLRQLV